MSVFDPKSFAALTFTDSNSTESVPIPVGDWLFDIEKAEIIAWQKRDDPTVGGLKCALTLKTEAPEIEAITGRKSNKTRYEMILDLTENGGLDFGKGMNVALGRAREACGLNKPGAPFSFDMFVGHQVMATVKHEAVKEQLVARATALAKPHG